MSHHTHRPRSNAAWPAVQMLAATVNQQVNRDTLRVGDEDRERAARKLGDHYAAGRLDKDEYDERLERAFSARTGGELTALFSDLPQERQAQGRPLPAFHDYDRRHHGHRVPFLPVLLILIGVAIFTSNAWVVWIGLGVLLLTRKFQRARRRSKAQSNGNRFAERGSWA
jgi:DUF1707 SHOCT-like domain